MDNVRFATNQLLLLGQRLGVKVGVGRRRWWGPNSVERYIVQRSLSYVGTVASPRFFARMLWLIAPL
jgi:hypothetical protein